MVFTMLRSCYTTKARMVANSDRESTIRWYFAPEGALVYPHRNSFGSLNWQGNTSAPNPIGEVRNRPRPYSNGATPACASGTDYWAGDPSWFRFGVPELLPEPKELNDCGLPVACPVTSLCQEWFPDGEEGRVVSTVFPNYIWHEVSVGPAATIWENAGGTAVMSTFHAENCGSFVLGNVNVEVFLPGMSDVEELVLVALDVGTHTGTWVGRPGGEVPSAFVATVTIPP